MGRGGEGGVRPLGDPRKALIHRGELFMSTHMRIEQLGTGVRQVVRDARHGSVVRYVGVYVYVYVAAASARLGPFRPFRSTSREFVARRGSRLPGLATLSVVCRVVSNGEGFSGFRFFHAPERSSAGHWPDAAVVLAQMCCRSRRGEGLTGPSRGPGAVRMVVRLNDDNERTENSITDPHRWTRESRSGRGSRFSRKIN